MNTCSVVLIILLIYGVCAFSLLLCFRSASFIEDEDSRPDYKAIKRCMKFAVRRGYDPYNSHVTQAECFRFQAGSSRHA